MAEIGVGIEGQPKPDEADVMQRDAGSGEMTTVPEFHLSPEGRALFPLRRVSDLEALFDLEVIQKEEPDLALFSIILGALENSLVHLDYSGRVQQGQQGQGSRPRLRGKRRGGKVQVQVQQSLVNVEFREAGGGEDEGSKVNANNGNDDEDKENRRGDFPPLDLDLVEGLYLKFKDLLRSAVDLTGGEKDVVKRLSDVVWAGLSRSYKADTPHIQTLYTYLTGRKLDSFGVSLAVIAGAQVLGLKDVHLMVSEDHSWVGFGGVKDKEGEEGGKRPLFTAEVTWHGKGVEDKRGKEVGLGDEEDSWLYLKGHSVYCSRHMEIAAVVGSMNSVVNSSFTSAEVFRMQKSLLWKLHEAGHLKKYPMVLKTLAELEEISGSGRDIPAIYKESIQSCRTFYANMHLYPYTSYAAYCYRHQEYKTALKYWASAARIIQKFKRGKNDEEIYREFFEISTDALVNVMKNSATGFSAHSIVRDPACFANLLRFFDGICSWEERSKASVVHITWAQAWVSAIGKFDYTIRRMVRLTESSLQDALDGKGGSEKGVVDDEFEKDSGIDEEEELSSPPSVTLFSKKMRQLKGFFKEDKYNPSAITLLLTAQTAAAEEEDGSGGKGETRGRPKRERRSSHSHSMEEFVRVPTAKRVKL